MKELVSVIVPIYNVEEFLPRCIDSIITQTYKNLEIILVDDGSPDNCPKICDDYLKKDKRIKVIHKENGGLSDARNIGIEQSSGKYLCFIDSDDFINKNMIEVLLANLKDTDSDLSICSFKKVSNSDMSDLNIETQNIKCYSKEECYNNLYNNLGTITTVAWNKLYKRNIWKELRYPKGKIHEDEFAIHYVISKCQKIVYTDLELYYYFERANSITKVFNVKRLHVIEALGDRMMFFKNNADINTYKKSCILYLKTICFFYRDINKYTGDKKVKRDLKNTFLKSYKKIKKEIKIPIRNRIQFWGMIYCHKLYCFLRKLLGRV